MKLAALAALAPLAVFALTACSGGPPTHSSTPADDAGALVDPSAPTDEDGGGGVDADANAPSAACASYPKGPYGVNIGQVLSPAFVWKGYAANETTVSQLATADLFDCDGSKGENAILFDVSAGWCAACETQAHDEAQLVSQYDQLGIKAVTLLIMDAAELAATTDTALDWRTTYGLTGVGVYADPKFFLQPTNTNTIGLPLTLVVDPRTMKVVAISEGYGSSNPPKVDPAAVSLAKKNQAK